MRKITGITLLEVVLVLAIIGLILTLTVRYFNVASTSEQVNQAMTEIQTITKASYQWLQVQRQADFASGNPIDINKLQQAGLIDATQITDPWGGAITVEPGTSDSNLVHISLPNVSEKICKNLKTRMSGVTNHQDCSNQTYYIEL